MKLNQIEALEALAKVSDALYQHASCESVSFGVAEGEYEAEVIQRGTEVIEALRSEVDGSVEG